jgi:anti-anti-sigma factor
VNGDARFSSRFEIDDDSRVCVVSLAGKFDPEAVDDLHPQVQELVRAGYRKFVFDLSGLDHIGSMGLRLLVGLAHQVKGDGSVSLCDLTGGVRSVIEVTRINRVLPTFASRTEAVESVRGK